MKTIMVPLDGFAYAEQALPHAIALAQRTHARLRLVHVLDMLARPPYAEHVLGYRWWGGGALEAARVYMRAQTQKARAVGITCTYSVLTGMPVPMLIEEAARLKADLIIMATHGRGPLSRLWLGNVADQMSNKSPVPVMFVRVTEHAVGVPSVFSDVLVTLDGSTLAEEVLDPVLELTRIDNSRITLLYVSTIRNMPIPLMDDYAQVVWAGSVDLFEDEQTGVDYLGTVAEMLRSEGVTVRIAVISALMSTEAEIRRYVRSHNVDLIALATPGHSLLRGLFGGSVTDRTIRRATIPVLVLPRPVGQRSNSDTHHAPAEAAVAR